METGLYLLSSILGAGYLLNKNKDGRKPIHSVTINETPRIGEDIYHSTDFYKHSGEEAKRVIKNWEYGKYPISTNIIPMYYNTLSVKQDVEKIPNSNYNDKLIYTVLDGLDAETQKTIQNKLQSPSYVLKHVPDNARAGSTDWGLVSGRPSSDRLESKEG